MKIVHISTRIKIKYGGGEKFLEQFITEISEHEHIFIGQDPVIFDIFKKHGKEAYSSPAGFEPITLKRKLIIPLSFILGFIQFIKFYRFWKSADVIYVSASSIAEPIFLLPWIKLFFPKKRMIQSMHCMCIDYYWKNPLVGILRNTWKSMEMVFVSNSQKISWEEKNLICGKNTIIHNGVKIYDFTPQEKDTSKIIIGYIGRMYFEKGVDTIIRALSLVKPDKQIEVLMAGTGEQLEEFKKLQISLNFDKNIEFKWLGFVEDTKSFYEKCDVIIFPSWVESFGLVVLESWERGLPVITSDIDSFKKIKNSSFEEEKTLTFRVKNDKSLADKISLYLSKLDTYNQISYKIKLHSLVENNFSLEQTFTNYKELFNNFQQK